MVKILLCYAYLGLFQTGSKGEKYSGLNNAEICKVYRQSMSDAKKKKKKEKRKVEKTTMESSSKKNPQNLQ